MNQEDSRLWLIQELIREQNHRGIAMPESEVEQKRLLQALFNVRPPMPVSQEFLAVQDNYLRKEARQKGIVDVESLPITIADDRISLWQGDITRLHVGAIVNAANQGLTGCYVPNHACIDNTIHTFAGIQLRLACQKLIDEQGYEEETGTAKITPGFNLPAEHVLHTVGPIVSGELTDHHRQMLRSSYQSCLELADQSGITSIAFCCISTGVFRFPPVEAAKIAVSTIKQFLENNSRLRRVVFNVFQSSDYHIYRNILGPDRPVKEGD